MSSIFTTLVACLLIVSVIMLLPLTSARALRRNERQTPQPFTVDVGLFAGLGVLEETTGLLNGIHQSEVAGICEVFQAVKRLEESLNAASDINSSINETATEIESMMCNKLQNISMTSLNNLAPDCSDEKFQLVCSRASIYSKAKDAKLSIGNDLQVELSSDPKPQWINEHIENENVRSFICEKRYIC